MRSQPIINLTLTPQGVIDLRNALIIARKGCRQCIEANTKVKAQAHAYLARTAAMLDLLDSNVERTITE